MTRPQQPGDLLDMLLLKLFAYRKFIVGNASLALVLAIAACGSDEGFAASVTPGASGTARPTTTSGASLSRPGPAHDVVGIAHWINSEPLSIQQTLNENKVVLVDFWTYTCVNCIRTLPFLQQWHEKYSDNGLVILGVHSPEFEFEKVLKNVEEASEQEGVVWPVAMDNDMRTWQAFGNRFWPAKYLLTPTGGVEYTHFGEGEYVETEQEIRKALTAAGWDISGIPVGTVNNIERDPVANSITREIYGGYERSYHSQGLYAGDEEYYVDPDATVEYVDDGEYLPQQFFLNGLWTNAAEAVIHARETEDLTDYIAVLMQARSANVVIEPQRPVEFRVYATLDDKPLTVDEAGTDIMFDGDGGSYFLVDEARMYRVVEQPEFKERLLKLSSTSDAFAVFAYTFGIYDDGF